MVSGGVIKFECVNDLETTTSGIDNIAPTSLTNAVLDSYNNINFNDYTSRYEATSD